MKGITQYHYNPETSAFHEAFRQLFITDPRLKQFKAYQEVNVQTLVPNYPYNNHHYDWYIEELGVVVELHGIQHYKMSKFGSGRSYDDREVEFYRSQYRDNSKALAARSVGLLYIAIPYTEQKKLSYDKFIAYMKEEQDA